MESGVINLRDIYKFVTSRPNSEEALKGNSPAGREFGRLCQKVTSVIPEEKGFYLWGNYDYRKFWRNIYLGKAGFGRITHLRSRILEELKDEKCCFYRVKHTEGELINIKEEYYPNKYLKNWKRSFLKVYTSHIVFVACRDIKEKDVKRIEADLIESMNPTANIERPVPPASLNADTTKIFNRFRYRIHSGRKDSYPIAVR